MRIVAFNQFFWPDQAATSQLLTDLVRRLALEGPRSPSWRRARLFGHRCRQAATVNPSSPSLRSLVERGADASYCSYLASADVAHAAARPR